MKWQKPSELTKPGNYVMGRANDHGDNLSALRIASQTSYLFDDKEHHLNDVQTWDEECRFFGPLPEVPK